MSYKKKRKFVKEGIPWRVALIEIIKTVYYNQSKKPQIRTGIRKSALK